MAGMREGECWTAFRLQRVIALSPENVRRGFGPQAMRAVGTPKRTRPGSRVVGAGRIIALPLSGDLGTFPESNPQARALRVLP